MLHKNIFGKSAQEHIWKVLARTNRSREPSWRGDRHGEAKVCQHGTHIGNACLHERLQCPTSPVGGPEKSIASLNNDSVGWRRGRNKYIEEALCTLRLRERDSGNVPGDGHDQPGAFTLRLYTQTNKVRVVEKERHKKSKLISNDSNVSRCLSPLKHVSGQRWSKWFKFSDEIRKVQCKVGWRPQEIVAAAAQYKPLLSGFGVENPKARFDSLGTPMVDQEVLKESRKITSSFPGASFWLVIPPGPGALWRLHYGSASCSFCEHKGIITIIVTSGGFIH